MSVAPKYKDTYVPPSGNDYANPTQDTGEYKSDTENYMPIGINMKPVTDEPDDTGTGDFSNYDDNLDDGNNGADNTDGTYIPQYQENKNPFENYVNDVSRPQPAKDYPATDMFQDECRPPINIMTKTNTPLQIKYKVVGSALDWQNLPLYLPLLSSFPNQSSASSKYAATASDIWTVNKKIKEQMQVKQIQTGKFEVQLIHLRTAEMLCNNLSTLANRSDYFFGVSIYPGEEIESLNNDVGPDAVEGGRRKTRKHRRTKKSKKQRKSKGKGKSRRRRTHKKK